MGEKILIVGDSESMRKILSTILESVGYDIERAEDGREALDVLQGNHSFDLILTDLNVPRIDGISLIGAVRACDRYSTLPILMLTTESHELFKARARSAGATGWIVKPFVKDKSLLVIDKVIR
jgi:two-component system, chemotaxis family, chemotaxis protein CheY